MSLQQEMWTSRQAADRLGVSDARVRQLCIQYNVDGIAKPKRIGQKVGHIWLLTDEDLGKIRALPEFRKKIAD